MSKNDIKQRLKREAELVLPDVLATVYQKLDLDQPPKRRLRLFSPITLLASSALAALVIALVVTSIDFSPVISSAETAIRIQMIAASSLANDEQPAPLIKLSNPNVEVPTFSYRIDTRGKTIPLDQLKNNALFAENEPARIIAGGLTLAATLNRKAIDLALDLTKLARQAGYFESYEIGNIVRFRLSGTDAGYINQLKEQIRSAVEQYFRNQLIYGFATADDELEQPDFSGYVDVSSQMSQYSSEFNNRKNHHADDDSRRGSNWGQDIDQWMNNHRGNHASETSSSSSESDDHRPSSMPGSGGH